MAPVTATATFGLYLRALRASRRLTISAVVKAAGWSREPGPAIGASDRPTRRTAHRYLAAIVAAAETR